MTKELRRRVEKIEAAFAPLDLSRMTAEEILALAPADCDGIPWSVFTDAELEDMVNSYPDMAAVERIVEAARARHLAQGDRQ